MHFYNVAETFVVAELTFDVNMFSIVETICCRTKLLACGLRSLNFTSSALLLRKLKLVQGSRQPLLKGKQQVFHLIKCFRESPAYIMSGAPYSAPLYRLAFFP